MPVRQRVVLLRLHTLYLRHRCKSSSDDLYKSGAGSFLPIPYPAAQEIRHADYSPIFLPDRKVRVQEYAIQADYHFLLSRFRIHGHPFQSCHYKRRTSSATCLLDGILWDNQSYDNCRSGQRQVRTYRASLPPHKSAPSVPA